MLDDLEKEIGVLAELFDELIVRLSPILLNNPDGEESQTEPPPPTPRSVICIRIEDLQKRVFSLRSNISETISRVDLP